MMVLIIISLIIIAILLFYIFRYKRNIKYITEQISESKGEYTSIRTKILDRDIEDLVVSINSLYEKEQKRYKKVEHNEEELRRSIANLSHDLRTPLTSIMGYIQLIKNDELSEKDKEKYLDIVDRRTETLQNLITSFYELSRVESSEYKFDLKSINLSNLLCESIALYYDEFVKNNIEPKIEVFENSAQIISDEKAVMRIFSNLINNIIKYGEGNVTIKLQEEENYLVTEFKNYAPNLNEEQAEHIFERFFTADLTRSDKNTGLGLSITRALVEQLGNKIESNLTKGILTIKVTWEKR